MGDSSNGSLLFLKGRTIMVENFQVGLEVSIASTEKE